MIRRIRLPHLYNFRDLGGYEADGGVTKWGRIFRGDCPSKLREDEWKRLKGLGIRQIIDLRSTHETAASPVSAPEGIICRSCSFLKGDRGSGDAGLAAKKFLESLSLDHGYSDMMKDSLDRVAHILNVVTEGLSDGSVYFFCSAGKDRTGMISAAILYLCGVSREDIVADYCITEVYNAEIIMRKIQSLPPIVSAKLDPDKMKRAVSSKAETMQELLNWMDEQDFITLMAENGFGEEEIKRLRHAFVAAAT